MRRKLNRAVRNAVDGVVYVAVSCDVFDAANWTVDRAVRGTVYWAVGGAVDRAVRGAAEWEHPAFKDYLREVSPEAGVE
jgi:hypothetical protein